MFVDEGGRVDDDQLVNQLRPHHGQKKADSASETVTFENKNYIFLISGFNFITLSSNPVLLQTQNSEIIIITRQKSKIDLEFK